MYAEAMGHLNRGTENGAKGDYGKANSNYLLGLTCLMDAIKIEPSGTKRDTMKEIMATFLKRAEVFKRAIARPETEKSIDVVKSPATKAPTRNSARRMIFSKTGVTIAHTKTSPSLRKTPFVIDIPKREPEAKMNEVVKWVAPVSTPNQNTVKVIGKVNMAEGKNDENNDEEADEDNFQLPAVTSPLARAEENSAMPTPPPSMYTAEHCLEEKSSDAESFDTAKIGVVEETVKAAVVEETVKAAVVEKTVKAAVVEKTVKAAVAEETVKATVVEETVKATVAEETVKATVVEETVKATVAEETVKAKVVEETVKDKVVSELATFEERPASPIDATNVLYHEKSSHVTRAISDDEIFAQLMGAVTKGDKSSKVLPNADIVWTDIPNGKKNEGVVLNPQKKKYAAKKSDQHRVVEIVNKGKPKTPLQRAVEMRSAKLSTPKTPERLRHILNASEHRQGTKSDVKSPVRANSSRHKSSPFSPGKPMRFSSSECKRNPKKLVSSPSRGTNSRRSGGKRNSDENLARKEFEDSVESEIMNSNPGVAWEDVSGLKCAKQSLQEAVILPMLRPDIFNGIRAPSKGVLLYGPPGTGKTLLAKAVATESNATFFSISASSLTSKWVGESSKLVRALFSLASKKAPSVVFIDEIDSVLSARSGGEHQASRQLKTEFLVQFDGAREVERKGHVLFIGATNRPWDLDEAVIRRLSKRVYIPLPDSTGRNEIIRRLMDGQSSLSEMEWDDVVSMTEGYSGSDLKAVCHEAALGPIRGLGMQIANVSADALPPVTVVDFQDAIKQIRPSVANDSLYEKWTSEFGTR